jgi:hypothetical protein
MVQTPVGARCRECAKLNKLPTFRVSGKYYLRAVGVALGMAVAGGILWWLIGGFLSFFYINILLGAGIGYATGEAISRSVNRKRSPGLAVIGSLAVVVSYVIVALVFRGFPASLFRIIYDLVAVGAGGYMAVNRLH